VVEAIGPIFKASCELDELSAAGSKAALSGQLAEVAGKLAIVAAAGIRGGKRVDLMQFIVVFVWHTHGMPADWLLNPCRLPSIDRPPCG
jgi:hypothetical protein